MRILLLHNYYQSSSPSGEDIAFSIEKQLLERAGHDVFTYVRRNDDIDGTLGGKSAAAVSLFWSQQSYREISELIRRERPQVAHFHNTFPLISASGYRACKANGVAVVQTLHNYRLICPGALLLRNGKPCEDCIGKVPAKAIVHGCYRGSGVASALVTGMLAFNRMRHVYERDVDRYICLTAFARERFIRGGLPAERLVVKPNTLLDPPDVGNGIGNYALYVGRLTAEKGIQTLIRSWRNVATPLKVAGDGALREELETLVRREQLSVEFLGFKPRSEVMQLIQNATMMIIPSECYEGFPVTALEGLATGTPMVVSQLGALDEILATGKNCLKFTAGDAVSLSAKVKELLKSEAHRQDMRRANRETFEQHYDPQVITTNLVNIYQELVGTYRAA